MTIGAVVSAGVVVVVVVGAVVVVVVGRVVVVVGRVVVVVVGRVVVVVGRTVVVVVASVVVVISVVVVADSGKVVLVVSTTEVVVDGGSVVVGSSIDVVVVITTPSTSSSGLAADPGRPPESQTTIEAIAIPPPKQRPIKAVHETARLTRGTAAKSEVLVLLRWRGRRRRGGVVANWRATALANSSGSSGSGFIGDSLTGADIQ